MVFSCRSRKRVVNLGGVVLEEAAERLAGVAPHCSKLGVEIGDIRDQVVSLLGLLQTTEGHLGTGDELLGVLEVLELEWGLAHGPAHTV